jgi:hypothetical protein
MNKNFARRIERLERQLLGTQDESQLIYVMSDIEGDDEEDTPWSIKLSPGIRAVAFGAPFSSEDVKRLRQQYADGWPRP